MILIDCVGLNCSALAFEYLKRFRVVLVSNSFQFKIHIHEITRKVNIQHFCSREIDIGVTHEFLEIWTILKKDSSPFNSQLCDNKCARRS